MKPAKRISGPVSTAEALRLVNEVACLASRVTVPELPAVIAKILNIVRTVAGFPQASLLDYVFNELYCASQGEEASIEPRLVGPFEDRVQLPGFTYPQRSASKPGISVAFSSATNTTLVNIPVSVNSQQVGLLFAVHVGQIKLAPWRERLLDTLASLTSFVLERRRYHQDSLRLRAWLNASGRVFSASQVVASEQDVGPLLREIADNALKISDADFVVLYEYFEEHNDIRLPPTLAGSLRDSRVLLGRGVALEHRRSTVFRVLERREPFYAPAAPLDWEDAGLIDAEASQGEHSFFGREGVVASAGLPLRTEQERVGVLFLNYRKDRFFSQEFRVYLELFANQAALAIGNGRFFQRSERYSRDLEVLNQIGRELNSAVSRSVPEIGRLINEQTMRVVPTANFFLCLYDAERDRFSLRYLRDERDTHENLEPRLREGLTGYVCRSGRPLLVTLEDQNELFAMGAAHLVGSPSAVWLGAPLIVRGKVIGAIVIQDYDDETAYTSEHLHLLAAIAEQAAIALDNYRLLHDTELRLVELSALLELSRAAGTRHLIEAGQLSLILDRICVSAEGDSSVLLLIDSGNDEQLKVVATSSNLKQRLGETILLGQGLSGAVAQTGEPLFVNDYAQWPDRSPIFPSPARRIGAVPLVSQARTIGVLTLSSNSETGQFSRREIEILLRFAGPLAIAIQNTLDREALLVAANAIAVGQIATSFLHEARNSLTAMSLTVVNLLEDIEQEPDLKTKRDYLDRLGTLQTEMERFDDLTRRLQGFTRQGLRPERRECHLNEVVLRTVQALEGTLRSKQLKLQTRLDPILNPPAEGEKGQPISVDDSQVQQVLMNLLLNAASASRARQTLVVETRNHDDEVEVHVTDYGTGISTEARKRLFQPFSTTKEDGVGLGLFLSRILIEENHGGRIEVVASEPGRGSTFAVWLPKHSRSRSD